MALTLDVAFAFAMSMELLVYGAYSILAGAALMLLWKRHRGPQCRGSSAGSIFFHGTWLMLVLATFHVALSLYRFICAYILKPGPLVGVRYMFDLKSWNGIVNNIIFCLMTWIGDILLIYRCYHVWNRNIWMVVLPLSILIAAVGINAYVIFWFAHYAELSLNNITSYGVVDCIYPVALAKNIFTTGLIAWKIWKQHLDSRTLGVEDRGSPPSLIQVLRIVIESAMVYTLQMLILMILNYAKSSVQFIIQSLVVPSIGIVFALISLRIHYANSDQCSTDGDEPGTPQIWLKEDASAIEFAVRNSINDILNVSGTPEQRSSDNPESISGTSGSSFNSSQKHAEA